MTKQNIDYGNFQLDHLGNTKEKNPFFGDKGAEMTVPVQEVENIKKDSFKKIENITETSLRDPLTHAYNRRGLSEKSKLPLKNAIEEGKPCSYLLIDADYFKKVNDTYGHFIGDVVLRRIADIIKNHIRNTDIYARFGGEEFVVLLSGTTVKKAVEIGEIIRGAIQKTSIQIEDEKSINITVSIGIHSSTYSELNEKNESEKSEEEYFLSQLFKSADLAMYASKENGRNQVTLYNKEMQKK